jgi:uncharacterized coiled-coil DUF342 family protein
MIDQTAKEIADAMREEPEAWAELYIKLRKQVDQRDVVITSLKKELAELKGVH